MWLFSFHSPTCSQPGSLCSLCSDSTAGRGKTGPDTAEDPTEQRADSQGYSKPGDRPSQLPLHDSDLLSFMQVMGFFLLTKFH